MLKANGDRYLIGAVGGGSSPSIALPEGATYMAAFSRDQKSEKIVHMQVMDLPVIAQTPGEIAALHEGLCHLTIDHNPHDEYGVRAGSVVLVQAESEGEQIALRVSGQHVIDEKIAAIGSQRWADAEKAPASALFGKLAAARADGTELWGLNVQPLGTYERGQIKQFETIAVEPLAAATEPSLAQADVEQLPVANAEQAQAPEPAAVPSGVMAAIARSSPQMQQRLERVASKGSSAKAEQAAIARDPQSNQQQPAKAAQEASAKPNRSVKTPAEKRRSQAKDSGMSY